MRITINDDFDLYKITYSGQCFRPKQLDDNTYSFITRDHKLTIKKLIGNEYEVSCTSSEWEDVWFDYFDLATNYAKIRESIPADDFYLNNAANIGAGIRILKQDKFEMLISYIISQRKSIPAIKSSVEKLCSYYGNGGYFPTPKALSLATSEDLAKCGLGYRVPYIIDAVKRVNLGEIDLDSLDSMSDDELFNTLKSFYGVGDKVANCVALFAYHRVGLAPIDTWIKKIIDSEYDGVNPFPSYGEYAGIMQQYMFYSAQHMHTLDKNKI